VPAASCRNRSGRGIGAGTNVDAGEGDVLDKFFCYPQVIDSWFINISVVGKCRHHIVNRYPQKSRSFSRAAYEQHRATSDGGDSIRSDSAPPGAYFIRRYQGGSHAEWPKDSHEHAPTQTGRITCSSPKAVDTEYRPPPVARVSKRPKKLRAISGASPCGSPVGECRRGGELLPTRRALLQIDVFEPRSDIDRDVPSRLTFAADALGCWPSPQAPREPSGASVDATLALDEPVQGLGIRLVDGHIPHHSRPLAPRPLVSLARVGGAPDDRSERTFPNRGMQAPQAQRPARSVDFPAFRGPPSHKAAHRGQSGIDRISVHRLASGTHRPGHIHHASAQSDIEHITTKQINRSDEQQ
jgi:hypothetical protein